MAQSTIIKTLKYQFDVVFLPALVQPESMTGRTVVVTDVLRATTTIVNSLANGCEQVLPQPSIEMARESVTSVDDGILGGERGGKIVDGFHQGNSPIEYTREIIAGKTLVLATTNGTVAMEHCRLADRILIGALINLGAIVEAIDPADDVTVMCSGTDGNITSEDVIFAGALMERLAARASDDSAHQSGASNSAGENGRPGVGQFSDLAKIAIDHWRCAQSKVDKGVELAELFRTARGGINLVKIGHDDDIVFASQIDTVPVVPELDVDSWSIRLVE